MSDFDGVGIGDLMTLEECAAEIGDLADKLEAERERVRVLRSALFGLVNEGRWIDGQWQADELAWDRANEALATTEDEE